MIHRGIWFGVLEAVLAIAMCGGAWATTPTLPPMPTPIPTVNECNPSAHDCPVGKECNCCCGTWVCMPPYLPCCALPCSDPTQLPTPTPTPTPSDGDECNPIVNNCPLGTTCGCCCGTWECLPLNAICCLLACPDPTPPTPTPVSIGIGEFCEPDRICPPPLLCLIEPPHQARVCSCVGDCDGNAAVMVDELVTLVNVALGNMGVSVCALGDANSVGAITGDEILLAVSPALYGCVVAPPTPAPTPVLYHGHTCCECAEAACMDFVWVEVERTCPLECKAFTDAECEAPCHGGPVGVPAVCVALTPCTTDADCDDGNGCTADRCTIDGCAHACVCD